MNFREELYKDNNLLVSDKILKDDLKSNLLECKKEFLCQLARNYNIKGFSKLNKLNLVDLLFENLNDGEKIINVLADFSVEEMAVLKELITSKVYDITKKPFDDYINLQIRGIAYCYKNDEKIFLTIPCEYRQSLASYCTSVGQDVSIQNENIDSYIKSFGRIYGLIDLDFFVSQFNNFEDASLTKNELLNYFKKKNNMVKNVHITGELMIHKSALDDNNQLKDLLLDRENRQYKELERDLILKYNDDYFIEIKNAHIEFIRFLERLNVDKSDATDIILKMNNVFRCYDFNMNMILDIFNRSFSVNIMNDVNMFNMITGMCIKICNNTRKWNLRGFTSHELINIKEANKQVGRNDLCPCGSGKKYKKCCLK